MGKIKKIIALMLVVTIFFASTPLEGIAETFKQIQPILEEVSKEESSIVGEINEKREENIKYFLKEDKTHEAAIYPNAVHYKESGTWKDIDNSLTEVSDDETNEIVLQNKHNESKIKIAKNANSERLIKIVKDKYKISWNMQDSRHSLAEVIKQNFEGDNNLEGNHKKKALLNITSAVLFENVHKNVDLRYDIISKDLKESIIIKDKVADLSLKFNLYTSNLVAKVLKDKTIIFYDSEDVSKEVFVLNAPFMFDSVGEESKDIDVVLTKKSDHYVLELKPNSDWLNDSNRKYPVTIDPTVATSTIRTKIYDNHVSEKLPGENFINSVMLKTGKGSTSGVNRTYISFDIPSLKTGDIVTNAELDLSLFSANTTGLMVVKVIHLSLEDGAREHLCQMEKMRLALELREQMEHTNGQELYLIEILMNGSMYLML